MASDECRDVALRALDAGISVVPPRGREGPGDPKAPLGEWKRWQNEHASPEQVRTWYEQDRGIGFVCGRVSGGLELFEFEGRAIERGIGERFLDLAEERGLHELIQRLCTGYWSRSPTGGWHWLYRCDDIGPGVKLAKDAEGKDLIETRGEGQYVVEAPTNGQCHPTGESWVMMGGGIESIPTIGTKQRQALFELAFELDESPRVEPPQAEDDGWRKAPAIDSWMDETAVAFEQSTTWADVLDGVFRELFTRNGITYWHYIGASNWVSATTNATGRDTLIVHSGTAQGQGWRGSPKSYDKLSARVRIQTGREDPSTRVEVAREIGLVLGTAPNLPVPVSDRSPIGQSTQGDLATADDAADSSWSPIDLTDALAGVIEPPTLWSRSDGACLLYPGRVHWFQGESETCKSWAAQVVTVEVLDSGGDVLYVDFEDDQNGVVSRLLALGADRQAIRDHLVYVRPDEPLRDRMGRWLPGAAEVQKILDARRYELAVIDGVTEAMVTEGLDLIDNSDIATWMRLLPKRLANYGGAVVCIDHVTKSADQGRYAIGGQHKLAGLTGAAYRFTMVRPLARATKEAIQAVIGITVTKDRPGWVRGNSPEGKAGSFELTAHQDGRVTASLEPASAKGEVDMGVVWRILRFLRSYDGASATKITESTGVGKGKVLGTLEWMVNDGLLRIEPKGVAHIHHLTEKGWHDANELPD